jgi:hypothetical protein
MAFSAALVRTSIYGAAVALATGCILLPLDEITEDEESEPDEPDPTPKPSAPKPSVTPPGTCVPDCAQAQCGDDGCGDVCGECDTSLEQCESGSCLFQAGVFATCTCDLTTASVYDVVPEPACASGSAMVDLCVDSDGNTLVCFLDDNGYPFYQWTVVCL